MPTAAFVASLVVYQRVAFDIKRPHRCYSLGTGSGVGSGSGCGTGSGPNIMRTPFLLLSALLGSHPSGSSVHRFVPPAACRRRGTPAGAPDVAPPAAAVRP